MCMKRNTITEARITNIIIMTSIMTNFYNHVVSLIMNHRNKNRINVRPNRIENISKTDKRETYMTE